MEYLHTYHDGTRLCWMFARSLLRIPIWKGQRTLDYEHARSIREGVGNNIRLLDRGYTLLRYAPNDDGEEVVSIIDGQHRAHVLKEYYAANPEAADFKVTATEKLVHSEEEALAFFRVINHAKPINLEFEPVKIEIEPTQIINAWLAVILAAFNSNNTHRVIRSEKTHAPYINAETIREWLQKDVLSRGYNCDEALAVLRVINGELIDAPDKENSMTVRSGLKCGFMLGFSRPADWTARLMRSAPIGRPAAAEVAAFPAREQAAPKMAKQVVAAKPVAPAVVKPVIKQAAPAVVKRAVSMIAKPGVSAVAKQVAPVVAKRVALIVAKRAAPAEAEQSSDTTA